MMVGTTDCNKSNILAEGWPNLQWHRLVVSIEFTSQELRAITVAITVGKEGESLERALETHDGKLSGKLLCNVYNPPNPIIFQYYKSWMKQYCERKMQQQEGCWVNLLMEIRLKEK